VTGGGGGILATDVPSPPHADRSRQSGKAEVPMKRFMVDLLSKS
jgi:hypothetical protein